MLDTIAICVTVLLALVLRRLIPSNGLVRFAVTFNIPQKTQPQETEVVQKEALTAEEQKFYDEQHELMDAALKVQQLFLDEEQISEGDKLWKK